MRRLRWMLWIPSLVICTSLFAQGPNGRTSQELQFRGGWFMPSADSDFWRETEEVFTIEGADLDDFVFGLSLVTAVSNHLEVGANVDFYDDSVTSAYRDFEDSAGFPIFHDSRLDLVPMMVDLRILPGGRHADRQARGAYPSRKPVAYFGGGIGVNYWSYEESGEFIDFGLDPPEIFPDRFEDDGFAFAVQALAGIEVPLGSKWNALVEGRYTWSSTELSGDFGGLGTIDLGGLALYVGVGVRF